MKLTESVKIVHFSNTNLTIVPIEGCRGIVVWRNEQEPVHNDCPEADVYIVKKGEFEKIGTAKNWGSLDTLKELARKESE